MGGDEERQRDTSGSNTHTVRMVVTWTWSHWLERTEQERGGGYQEEKPSGRSFPGRNDINIVFSQWVDGETGSEEEEAGKGGGGF